MRSKRNARAKAGLVEASDAGRFAQDAVEWRLPDKSSPVSGAWLDQQFGVRETRAFGDAPEGGPPDEDMTTRLTEARLSCRSS